MQEAKKQKKIQKYSTRVLPLFYTHFDNSISRLYKFQRGSSNCYLYSTVVEHVAAFKFNQLRIAMVNADIAQC